MNSVQTEDLQVQLETGASARVGAGDRKRAGHAGVHLLRRLAQLLVLFVMGCTGPARPAEPVVILLSWDGVRHDYPERASLPALERMQREGLRAQRLIPVFPSNTFPNHVSLATGAYTDRHGVVGNIFRDRQRGRFDYDNDASWLEAEPIWVTAERQGVRSAVFFWVGSETDWRGTGASYRKTPFDTRVPEREKVDQILAWLDLPAGERPRLILSWWHGADSVGHREGPDDEDVAEQLRRQDRQLGRLLAGLDRRRAWSHTTLILVSDHGMARADRSIDVVSALKRQGIGLDFYPGGGVAFLWLDQPQRRKEALKLLTPFETFDAYPSEELPAAWRGYYEGRTGHIVVITRPPHTFYRAKRSGPPTGTHGYAPELPEMSAIFYAMGRDIADGAVREQVRTIDVAPTVSRLLGIEPPRHADGRALDLSSAEEPSE